MVAFNRLLKAIPSVFLLGLLFLKDLTLNLSIANNIPRNYASSPAIIRDPRREPDYPVERDLEISARDSQLDQVKQVAVARYLAIPSVYLSKACDVLAINLGRQAVESAFAKTDDEMVSIINAVSPLMAIHLVRQTLGARWNPVYPSLKVNLPKTAGLLAPTT
ncbi:unnamed protein product [Rhizoctonia solani]|uniref:Uncharacterized protein n=1 Tax=Rhizoctonia solani TaxID=456999 RepID=A0A8H3GJX2_9AGAM|nr:unnamed protein product [Rhizoctonia solani]